jgi:hypothetical protein
MAEPQGGGAGESPELGGVQEGGEYHLVLAFLVVLEVVGAVGVPLREERDVPVEGSAQQHPLAPQRLYRPDLLFVDLHRVFQLQAGVEEGDGAIPMRNDDAVGVAGDVGQFRILRF